MKSRKIEIESRKIKQSSRHIPSESLMSQVVPSPKVLHWNNNAIITSHYITESYVLNLLDWTARFNAFKLVPRTVTWTSAPSANKNSTICSKSSFAARWSAVSPFVFLSLILHIPEFRIFFLLNYLSLLSYFTIHVTSVRWRIVWKNK